jgi:tetratricopeptide (TPR) repeat protein
VEAARAVALDPKSPAVLMTQGWILQNGSLGNRFGSGFDLAGAIAAYTKAIPIRTEDFDPRFDLAVLDEFDANGVRYSPSANLPDAIALYRALIEDDLKKNSSQISQHRINLGYALLYHHDYSSLEKLLPDIPPGINQSALSIAVAVAEKDAPAGLAAADHLNLSVEDRNKALLGAGDALAQLGMYAQASSILSAGIQAGTDAPATARLISMYKTMHRVPKQAPPVTTPESAVYAELNLVLSGNPSRTELSSLLSRHAYASDAAFQRNLDKNLDHADLLHVVARNSQMSEIILRDVMLGSTTFKTTGSDATGYRVISQTVGSAASQSFVVREDGTFRVVADNSDTTEVGTFALYALAHNQPALAKSILDWKRDLLHKGGGDDPFSGPLLPRFWTVGSLRPDADSPESIRLAAISLLTGSMEIKPYLAQVVSVRDHSTGSRQTDLDLLLAEGYVGSEQPTPALRYIDALLEQEPDSTVALDLAGGAYAMNHNASAMKALLTPRLARRPTDPDLLRAQMAMFVAQHDYPSARKSVKVIFDSGQAIANDYNNYAWLGLFDYDLGTEITTAAQQANTMSRNSNFAYLHTLACIYAAQDKVTEARQVLSRAMIIGNLGHPNSAVWYALGLLYEDYGLPQAAVAAYNRVQAHEFDDHTYVDPESAYILAQKRIAALKSASQNGGAF